MTPTDSKAAGQSSAPYIIPFAVFLALLAVQNYVPLPQREEFGLRLVILAGVLWYFSRHVISFRLERPLLSVALGVGVFVLWVAPDVLIPGYRTHWLFSNALTGSATGSVSAAAQQDFWLLLFRTLRATLIVPIVEELFWRAWMMRWLVDREFWKIPLGTYLPSAFWITALLFASEHGPYWEVGLLAGIVYNWWTLRTRSLGDLILAHAVTNGCLSAYVIFAHKWEYWL